MTHCQTCFGCKKSRGEKFIPCTFARPAPTQLLHPEMDVRWPGFEYLGRNFKFLAMSLKCVMTETIFFQTRFKENVNLVKWKKGMDWKSPFHLPDVGLDEDPESFPYISTQWLGRYSPASWVGLCEPHSPADWPVFNILNHQQGNSRLRENWLQDLLRTDQILGINPVFSC